MIWKITQSLAGALLATGFLACNQGGEAAEKTAAPLTSQTLQTAVLAGGCFWCMEAPIEKLPGVVSVVSGYMGGAGKDPTYEDYAQKGHVEVVKVFFDPAKITYDRLLDFFWWQINPTDAGGQFVDRGPQYRSAIFYSGEEQKRIAEKSKRDLAASGRFDRPIATEILPAGTFYKAEDYHQDYYKTSSLRYKLYRSRSGRDAYLEKARDRKPAPAGKETSAMQNPLPTKEQLKEKLTPLQYKVTQEEGTEPAFSNEYNDNKRPGIYVDLVSGEPLFSSLDKFDSGTGWPSFTKPLEPANVAEKVDKGLFTTRTEVRSKRGDAHLGHVFPDGPKPTGLRYCMNSAALRFIPKEDLRKEGYEKYEALFVK